MDNFGTAAILSGCPFLHKKGLSKNQARTKPFI